MMMIGGFDIVLSGEPSPHDLGLIVGALRSKWPNLVVQRDGAPFGNIFVYRDTSAVTSWRDDGATEDNGDSMLHVLRGHDSITFVVAAGESETRDLAELAIAVLRASRTSK